MPRTAAPSTKRARAALAVAALCACEPGLMPTESATVALPGGQFRMGSSQDCNDPIGGASCKGDRVEHLVRVSPFLIQATEVTYVQYDSCVLTGRCPDQGAFEANRKNRPILVDDPAAARAYCATLGMRLPTEAEFEFASRVDGGGVEHTYPWGDAPPTCDKLNLASCSSAFSLDVGSARGDVSAAGVRDLAGSAPEWVDDNYNPFVGCLDRIGYGDLCYGQGAACLEARCTADDKQCARGCLPAGEDTSSAGRGAQITSTPVCPMYADAATLAVDPVARSASGLAVVRGGSPVDGACVFAGFARRHAVPHRYAAGFRCARSGNGAVATPAASYRFTLQGCPTGAATVRVSAATDRNPNASFHLDWFPGSGGTGPGIPGGMGSLDAMGGVVDGAPCDALFVLAAAPTPLSITVKATGQSGCKTGTRGVDLSGGGDVPALSPDTNFILHDTPCP